MNPVWYFLNGVPVIPVIQIAQQALAGDGSASAPSYSFASDPDTGLYRVPGGVIASVDGTGYSGTFTNQFQLASGAQLTWSSGTITQAADVSLSRGAPGTLTLNSATATPAGGSTALRLVFGSTAGFGIYIGSGVPTVSAAQGSLYLRSDGSSTSTRAYINSSSGSGTTWTAITTAG